MNAINKLLLVSALCAQAKIFSWEEIEKAVPAIEGTQYLPVRQVFSEDIVPAVRANTVPAVRAISANSTFAPSNDDEYDDGNDFVVNAGVNPVSTFNTYNSRTVIASLGQQKTAINSVLTTAKKQALQAQQKVTSLTHALADVTQKIQEANLSE